MPTFAILDLRENSESSFPVLHKVCKVGTFVLLKFENKMDREIIHLDNNSNYHDKCKFESKLIRL